MNIVAKSFAMLLVLTTSACMVSQRTAPQRVYPQETATSFQVFYDQLAPYGSWVEYRNYGYVWIPEVDRDFSPYSSNGHWVYTDAGWTWASDYPWGWAAFHYGRWDYNDELGWYWIPGNDWGPAWVTWRRAPGYYGWAPMGPGVSVDVSFGREYRVPSGYWTFVNERDIDRTDIDRRYVDRSTNITIINNTTIINTTHVDDSRHTVYVSGPERGEVERVTSQSVRPISIRENDRPGQALSNDQLRIYRPQVRPQDKDDPRVAPSKLRDLKDVRRNPDRNAGDRRQEGNPPPALRGAGDPRRELSPPDKEKSIEKAPERQNVKPAEPLKEAHQPPVGNPSEKRKIEDQQPEIQKERPTDSKGREQPWIGTPPEKRRSTDRPPDPRNTRPPDVKSQQPPKVSTPPNGRGGRVRMPQPGKTNQPKRNMKKPAEGEQKPDSIPKPRSPGRL